MNGYARYVNDVNLYNMKKNIFAFSLLEVVIAAWILTVTIFWVYKLIAENTRLMKNASDYKQWSMLFISIKECIENIWFNNFKTSTQTWYSFNFWPTWNVCLTGSYDSNYTFSWVEVGSWSYFLFWEITNSWSNFINWNLSIFNENIGKIQKTMIDYK